jgi:hypothetical protein
MNFNKLVHAILETRNIATTIDRIPAHDGEREIYCTWCNKEHVWGITRSLDETDVAQFDDLKKQISTNGTKHDRYISNNGHKALEVYKHFLSNTLGYKKHMHEALKIASPLAEFQGVFQVVKSETMYISFTVEIDIVATRLKQIHNNFKDADTTGLEDLL